MRTGAAHYKIARVRSSGFQNRLRLLQGSSHSESGRYRWGKAIRRTDASALCGVLPPKDLRYAKLVEVAMQLLPGLQFIRLLPELTLEPVQKRWFEFAEDGRRASGTWQGRHGEEGWNAEEMEAAGSQGKKRGR